MSFTPEHLQALEAAMARGERRVTFQDRSVEYRSVEELQTAIREVKRGLAAQGQPVARQIRITTNKAT
ncbi:phage head-tail joining protein [Methylococcus capsulatus]|jgi:hypothetical protein|uniref:Uncharacterized protein n=1 Tax=Methylococcus capsulatus TaxID=414 RepID=A0AA35V4E5_METCP|nr:hypothetical protein [Methylococcus capsulatus]QXP89568.1 hypothetical protein KW114_10675 [Methylococcus capsulatus]CAI8819190.1 conserved protein of unknown function [Methylococcus capsulatus]